MPVAPIVFFFDFSSPYAYLASTQIEGLGAKHERGIEWVPMLLGPVFGITGARPLIEQPLKGDYARVDIPRSARWFGVPYVHPTPFPLGTQQAARVVLGLQRDQPELAVAWIHAVYGAYFAQGRNISDMAVLHELGIGLGLDAARIDAWCGDAAIKTALKANVERAIGAGVCGAPYFLIDGEPFWGVDRLPQMDRWMRARF
jgi:2-hydroxychromene-2-carboxylate isomerase